MEKVAIFWYTVIIIITVFIFSKIEIQPNIIIGIVVSFIIIYLLHTNVTIAENNKKSLSEYKLNSIYPKTKNISNYDKIINFLFSVQDLYSFNPQSYISMCEHIDYFFELYDQVLIDNSLADTNYQLMVDHKNIAIKLLQTFLFRIQFNKMYDKKLEKSIITLNTILNDYIENVYNIYKKYIYHNGYSSRLRLIERGPNAIDMNDVYMNNEDILE